MMRQKGSGPLTPYMFFWQACEEVESRTTVKDLAGESFDVAAGMVYANLIFYFIILVGGAVLYRHGGGIETVADAAASLRPLAGPAATALFAVGIIVSGVLSIPVMAACSAYGLAEVIGWRAGLDRTVAQAREFYLLLTGALVVGAAIALVRISPVVLMFWSQVLNGFLLAPLFAVLLLLANDQRVLRAHRNRLLSNLVGWATVALTAALGVLTIQQLAAGH